MFPFVLDEGLSDLLACVGYVVADVVHLFLSALDFVSCSTVFDSWEVALSVVARR